MTDPSNKVIDQLNELLEAERHALLGGDIAALEGLSQEKVALLDELHAVEDPVGLDALSAQLERNSSMLSAATAGIRDVANRLRDMRRLRYSLQTYTQEGQRASIDTDAASTLEKRA